MNKDKKMSFKEIVEKSKIKQIYNENKKNIQLVFAGHIRAELSRYEHFVKEDAEEMYYKTNNKGSSPNQKFHRLVFGYNGLGFNFSGTKVGLYSEGVLNLEKKGKLCTMEHVVGVTEVGRIVWSTILSMYKAGKSVDEIVDYMINQWLENNLHLWCQVQILKSEDRNLKRAQHTYDEKMSLVHYDEANIKIVVKK
tara:strand:+ start:75 stop:659 length:585 start_codon:yes stop_codon:yes gene_type:complete